MNRTLTAARLNLVDPGRLLAGPWIMALGVFALNLAVRATVSPEAGDGVSNGVILLFLGVFVVFWQSMVHLLPYAAGLGLSRRSFYRGTALTAVGLALANGVALSALTELEEATGGWGTDFAFFAPGVLDADAPLVQVAMGAGPTLAAAFLGIAFGATKLRWGTAGSVALGATLIALVTMAIALAPLSSGLGAALRWLGDLTAVWLVPTVPTAVALVFAGYAYLVVRRAAL